MEQAANPPSQSSPPRSSPLRCVWLFALLLGCAQPREINDVLAAHQSSERYVAPPRSLAPRPWQVGQWSLHKLSAAGRLGYIKTSIVAKAACGWWLEMVVVAGAYADRVIVKVCFRSEPDLYVDIAKQVGLVQAFMSRVRDRTVVIDLRDGKNPNTRAMVERALASTATLLWRSPPSEQRSEIVVPAGQFAGAARAVMRYSVDESLHTAQIWFHSDVPFSGTLESTSTEGLETTLLDYGLSGSTSELPDFDQHLRDSNLE